MSERECRQVDWYEQGIRDGAYGYDSGRVISHTEACGKLGIVPDRKAYFDGREQGLRRYCTAESGYNAGRYGRHYAGVCVGRGEPEFLNGYQQGRQRAVLEDDRDRLDREITSLEKQLKQVGNENDRNLLRHRIILREEERIRIDRAIRMDHGWRP